MTTTDETTTNGYTDSDAAARLPLKPLNLTPANVPDWGSVPEVVVHAGALKAGETDEEPVEFTETVLPAASMTERVEVAAGERPPALPAWLKDRQLAREAAARQARWAGYAVGRGAVQTPRSAGRMAWWTLRGAAKAIRSWGKWVWDFDGHPLLGKIQAESDKAYVRIASDRAMRQKVRLGGTAVLFVLLAVTLLIVRALAPWALILLASTARRPTIG
jgi:hypothetical protein